MAGLPDAREVQCCSCAAPTCFVEPWTLVSAPPARLRPTPSLCAAHSPRRCPCPPVSLPTPPHPPAVRRCFAPATRARTRRCVRRALTTWRWGACTRRAPSPCCRASTPAPRCWSRTSSWWPCTALAGGWGGGVDGGGADAGRGGGWRQRAATPSTGAQPGCMPPAPGGRREWCASVCMPPGVVLPRSPSPLLTRAHALPIAGCCSPGPRYAACGWACCCCTLLPASFCPSFGRVGQAGGSRGGEREREGRSKLGLQGWQKGRQAGAGCRLPAAGCDPTFSLLPRAAGCTLHAALAHRRPPLPSPLPPPTHRRGHPRRVLPRPGLQAAPVGGAACGG